MDPRKLTVLIPLKAKAELKALSEQLDKTQSALITEALKLQQFICTAVQRGSKVSLVIEEPGGKQEVFNMNLFGS